MRQERVSKLDLGGLLHDAAVATFPQELPVSAAIETTLTTLKTLPLTQQQRELVETIERRAEELGRMPSAHEVRECASAESISRISIDRIHKLLLTLNQMLPDGLPSISFTPHRPHLLYRLDVQRIADAYREEHFELPTPSTVQKLLKEKREVVVSKNSLSFIMKELYQPQFTQQGDHTSLCDKALSTFRTSRKKIAVSWRDIANAHGEAVRYLAEIPASRPPSAEEIGHFLRKAGLTIKNDALRFRLRNIPHGLSLQVAAYSDLTPEIIRSCHTRLVKRLRREPTIKELTKAFNGIALEAATPDALWTRIQRMNRNEPSRTIVLNNTRRSGVYDQDILRVLKNMTKQLKRTPTFGELFAEVRSQNQDIAIREDSFQRRIKKLTLNLTRQFELKTPEQDTVRNVIGSLKKELGRGPLKEEVLERCQKEGRTLSERDLVRILGAIKKSRDPETRKSLYLESEFHAKANLKQVVRGVHPSLEARALAEHVTASLGWTQRGVYRIAHLVAKSADRSSEVIEDYPTEETLHRILKAAQEAIWDEHRDIWEGVQLLRQAFGRAPLTDEVHRYTTSQGTSYTLYRLDRILKKIRAGVYPELRKMLRLGKRPEQEGKLRQLVEQLSPSVDPAELARCAQNHLGWSLEGTYEIARAMAEAAEHPSKSRKHRDRELTTICAFARHIEEEIGAALTTVQRTDDERLFVEEVMGRLSTNQLPYTPDQVLRYLKQHHTNETGVPTSSRFVSTTEQRVQQLREIIEHKPYPLSSLEITTRVAKELGWNTSQLTKIAEELLIDIAKSILDAGDTCAKADRGSLSPSFVPLLSLVHDAVWPEQLCHPLVLRQIIAHITHRVVDARINGRRDAEAYSNLLVAREYSQDLLKGWDFPEFSQDQSEQEMQIDKLLVDAEVLWICLSALPNTPQKVTREPFEIRKLEARWCAQMDVLYHQMESFHGMAHAVIMAQLSKLIEENHWMNYQLIPSEDRLNGRGYAYLKGKIQELAVRLGFSRSS
jgi:hypothetical protein